MENMKTRNEDGYRVICGSNLGCEFLSLPAATAEDAIDLFGPGHWPQKHCVVAYFPTLRKALNAAKSCRFLA